LAAKLLSLISFFNLQGILELTLQRYSRDTVEGANAEDREGKQDIEDREDREEANSAFNKDLDML
jgi:hypothetical protein